MTDPAWRDGPPHVIMDRMLRPHRATIWQAAALLALVLAVYFPALSNGFIWDDDDYVTHNPVLRERTGLIRIWFEPTSLPQYYPLVHTTFWLEYRAWGLDPRGYHLVNVLLHASAALLAWRVMLRLGLSRGASILTAAVFAVHPVHVESVAWITERKNVLMTVLTLASLLAYLRFDGETTDNRAATPQARWRWYGFSLGLFVLAMLSKTVAASLPVSLAVILWWKRGPRPWRQFLPLVPYVLIAVPLGLVTVWLEKSHVGAAGEDWSLSWLDRVVIAGRAVWFYAGKLLAPIELIFIYPRWEMDSRGWGDFGYPAALAAVVTLLWLGRRRWGRGVFAAVVIFLLTLAPALGFIDFYPMRFSFVADHFQYPASLAMIALASALACEAARRCRPLIPLLFILVGIAGWRTAVHLPNYRDAQTLWRHTLAHNPSAWIAHANLGLILMNDEASDEAEVHFRRAIELNPRWLNTRAALGDLLFESGRPREAAEQYLAAIELIRPDDDRRPKLLGRLAESLRRSGREDEALKVHRRVIDEYDGLARFNPHNVLLLTELATAHESVGHFERAREVWRMAWVSAPHDPAIKQALQRLRSGPGGASQPGGLRDVPPDSP